jgi:hypothetical protein
MLRMYKLAGFSLILFLFSSCSVLKPTKQVDTSQKALVKQEKVIEQVNENIARNDKNKKIETSSLATGVQYSLNQVTNPPVQVATAQALNERVISIVGSPHLDEIKRIKATVDLLNSEIAEERKRGQAELDTRDAVITALQKEKIDLKEKYDTEVTDLSNQAMGIAKAADNNQATLNSMSGMFGLNAVFWGIKKFFFSMLTFILIGGVLFIILRLLSVMNPVAAAVFSVFSMVGSVLITILKSLTPNAISMAGLAPSSALTKYKTVLTKVVDVIQSMKERNSYIGDTQTKMDLTEVLSKLSHEMNDDDKSLIDEILVEQKWRKSK